MEKRAGILKPIGAWYAAGGLITVVSSLIVFFLGFKLGVLFAIPAFILFVLLGSNELSTGLSIWRSETGSYRSIVSISILTVLVRLVFIGLLWSDVIKSGPAGTVILLPWENVTIGVLTFYLNLVWLVVECVLFLYLSRRKRFFMAQGEACNRPDLATCSVKSVSECPQCHEVVETYWQSCPYCGTALPRICAECGEDLGDMLMKCPHCGAEIMQSESMKKTIAMFEKLTQEKALPETQAVRYARLAEALLKNGQADEAVAAYKKAMSLTEFPVKRTNFMVQAARILKNTGRDGEAMKLLDEAVAIDPADRAGAAKVRSEMPGAPSA